MRERSVPPHSLHRPLIGTPRCALWHREGNASGHRLPGTLLIHLRDAGEECPRPARRRTQEDGRTAITLRGPCTPMVRVSSMSAVRLGPVIREMLRGGSPESAPGQSSLPARNRSGARRATWTAEASPGRSDVPPRLVWTIVPDSARGNPGGWVPPHTGG